MGNNIFFLYVGRKNELLYPLRILQSPKICVGHLYYLMSDILAKMLLVLGLNCFVGLTSVWRQLLLLIIFL